MVSLYRKNNDINRNNLGEQTVSTFMRMSTEELRTKLIELETQLDSMLERRDNLDELELASMTGLEDRIEDIEIELERREG